MNLVIISGRLGDDPEQIQGGIRFSVAVKDFEKVYWVRVIAFKNIPPLNKGTKILITGRFIDTDNQCKIIADRIEYA